MFKKGIHPDLGNSSVCNDLPGFERWDDILQVRYPKVEKNALEIPPDHPRWILIYGWGDALPKHINKYCEKYLELFPYSPQILISCYIRGAGYKARIDHRAQPVSRIIGEVFRNDDGVSGASENGNILVHSMSSMGSIFYASTLYAFEKVYHKPMPHTLLVMDSTPGATAYTPRNIMLWGGAAALKISRETRIPFIAANIYSSLLFIPARIRSFLVGQDPPGAFSRKAMNSADYIDPSQTSFLYLYGKDDRLIHASDIETHIAQSRDRGWQVDVERFEGTQHVGHMRSYPDRYWGAVCNSWTKAVTQRNS